MVLYLLKDVVVVVVVCCSTQSVALIISSSSDYLLVFHDDGLESKTEDIRPTTLQQMDPCHESFQQDDLVQDEVDPLMEMVVVELEEPLILEHVIDESDIPIVLSSESELDKSTNQQAASSGEGMLSHLYRCSHIECS